MAAGGNPYSSRQRLRFQPGPDGFRRDLLYGTDTFMPGMPHDANLQDISVCDSRKDLMAKAVEVAAGLICDDGRYLIAKRRTGVQLAGLGELPGGKREQGESLEECLQRELYEELSIRIDIPVPFP